MFCENCWQSVAHKMAHDEECPILQYLFSASQFVIQTSRDQRLLIRLLIQHSKSTNNNITNDKTTTNFIKDEFRDCLGLLYHKQKVDPEQLQAFGECGKVALQLLKLKKPDLKITLTADGIHQHAPPQHSYVDCIIDCFRYCRSSVRNPSQCS